jgi:regulator of sigma E protease
MPAETAGVKAGDIVESIDGTPILGFRNDLLQAVTLNEGRSLTFVLRRGSETVTTSITPVTYERSDGLGSKIQLPAIGIKPGFSGPQDVVEFSVGQAVYRGYTNTYWYCGVTLQFIGKLIMGSGDYKQLSGPLGIAKKSGQVLSTFGWISLINLVAVLSVSIGLLNLFPIPMLDGGHLAFYGYEAVRGQPLTESAQEKLALYIGVPLLLLLVAVATTNDVINVFSLG